jgi:non-heme chloroperoxidase
VTDRWVEVEPGVTLFARDDGDGSPVVLLAGLGLNHRVWDGTASALLVRHRVLRIDVRGHGMSSVPDHGYDLDRLAADVAMVMDSCEVTAAAVVGWSFGGQIAFRLAACRPDLVRRLVLVASSAVRASRSAEYPFGTEAEELVTLLGRGELEDRPGARRATITAGFADPAPAEVVDRLVGCSLSAPSHAVLACYTTMAHADLIRFIPEVRMPVLQIAGTCDPALSLRAARWLTEHLPNARLIELHGCGHYPMIEQPARFEAALLEGVG